MVTWSRAREGRGINVVPGVEFRPDVEIQPEIENPAEIQVSIHLFVREVWELGPTR